MSNVESAWEKLQKSVPSWRKRELKSPDRHADPAPTEVRDTHVYAGEGSIGADSVSSEGGVEGVARRILRSRGGGYQEALRRREAKLVEMEIGRTSAIVQAALQDLVKDPPVSEHPFQVLMENDSGRNAKVVLASSLYKSLQPNDKQAITGLNTWFSLTNADAIWLGIVFASDGSCVSASIDSWGQGDSFQINKAAWSGNNGFCEDNGSDPRYHQTSRKLIAYTTADGDGNPVLHQVMFHDQVLRLCNINGRAAQYPFDHEGGYPL